MNTKENILYTALRLFASRGFEAVSISDIAGELNLTKGALYKHYKSKRDILDSIIFRIKEENMQRENIYHIPEETYEEAPDKYEGITLEKSIQYAKGEFAYWAKNEFALLFRRLLTIEQYANQEMGELYQLYILNNGLSYIENGFTAIAKTKKLQNLNSKAVAVEFYAPYYLLLNLCDTAKDKEEVEVLFGQCMDEFYKKYKEILGS